MLINLFNHFISLSINECMDGGETTTQSCFVGPESNQKSNLSDLQCHKVQ